MPIHFKRPLWLQFPDRLTPRHTVLIAVLVVVTALSAVLHLTAELGPANVTANAETQLAELQYKAKTLDLALEFGYDPMIVQVARVQAHMEFARRQCKCPTWRFIRTEEEFTHLLLSVVQVESHGDPHAVNSSSHALGLTQLMLSTAQMYDKKVTSEQLLTISKNLNISVRHLSDLLEKYHGNFTLAVMAWNRGGGAVDRTLAFGDYPGAAYANAVFLQAAMHNGGTN